MNDQKNDVPMIEEYRYESAMMHATKKSKYAIIAAIFANIVTIIALIVVFLVVQDFTTKYNARTNKWLDTIMALVNRTAVTEVTDGYTEILQQLPPP